MMAPSTATPKALLESDHLPFSLFAISIFLVPSSYSAALMRNVQPTIDGHFREPFIDLVVICLADPPLPPPHLQNRSRYRSEVTQDNSSGALFHSLRIASSVLLQHFPWIAPPSRPSESGCPVRFVRTRSFPPFFMVFFLSGELRARC